MYNSHECQQMPENCYVIDAGYAWELHITDRDNQGNEIGNYFAYIEYCPFCGRELNG